VTIGGLEEDGLAPSHLLACSALAFTPRSSRSPIPRPSHPETAREDSDIAVLRPPCQSKKVNYSTAASRKLARRSFMLGKGESGSGTQLASLLSATWDSLHFASSLRLPSEPLCGPCSSRRTCEISPEHGALGFSSSVDYRSFDKFRETINTLLYPCTPSQPPSSSTLFSLPLMGWSSKVARPRFRRLPLLPHLVSALFAPSTSTS